MTYIDDTQDFTFTERLIAQIDNRDPGTTWIWLSNHEYVEVGPNDLMRNMIENCYNEDVTFLYQQFTDYLDSSVETIVDVKDDVLTDHIKGFHQYLGDLIRRAETGDD